MAYSSSYYSTYGWHPRSVAAAIATIRFIRRHQREIEAHVEEMSRYFRERLLRMPFREQADVRVVGLAIGVEFENDEYATAIADRARERGLLISEESGELFTLFPPLNVAREVAAEGLDILSRCL
jgi:4-aminobutyrate aminotransferase-like enzyme